MNRYSINSQNRRWSKSAILSDLFRAMKHLDDSSRWGTKDAIHCGHGMVMEWQRTMALESMMTVVTMMIQFLGILMYLDVSWCILMYLDVSWCILFPEIKFCRVSLEFCSLQQGPLISCRALDAGEKPKDPLWENGILKDDPALYGHGGILNARNHLQ